MAADTKRNAIAERLLVALGTVSGVVTVARNRQVDLAGDALPALILMDGDENLAPWDNARIGVMFRRWNMQPKIRAALKLAGKTESQRRQAIDELYAATLDALRTEIESGTLASYLEGPQGLTGASYAPMFEDKADPSYGGFELTLELQYLKD